MTTSLAQPTMLSDVRPPALVSAVMKRVGSRNTEPERIFKKALRAAGVRSFRACDTNLPGKPDIVIPGKGLVIFIDGDFWHGHQHQTRGFESVQAQLFGVHNADYWTEKLIRNVNRDFKVTRALLNSGWRVLRFWESNIRKSVDKCVEITLRSMDGISESAAFSSLPHRTAVEFFAGIGLVRLALHRSGWRTIFANDNDPKKLEMYRTNFGTDGLDPRSIHDLVPKNIPQSGLMTASFPCNDLSVAGARTGLDGKHSGTFWSLIRLLRGMKENAPHSYS